MNILYDFQIFYEQIYGGVSRYHMELVKVLNQYFEKFLSGKLPGKE